MLAARRKWRLASRQMTSSLSVPAALGDDVQRFLQSGLGIVLASGGERLVPSIARGVGCRVEDQGRRLRVLLFASSGERLLQEVAEQGRVAVCFNHPSSHRTLQLKGSDARAQRAGPQDVATARRQLDLFATDVGSLGWDACFVDTLLWRDPAELMAVSFTPDDVFVQTPGPAAGTRLAGG